MKRDLAAAALFVVLSVVMTWPLARVIDRGVVDIGDPHHLSWVLDWDYYATLHQPFRLFEANIFYPAHYSLAFSENLYGIALFLFPLRFAGASAITAHGIALIAAFAFSGFGAYLLGRSITGCTIPALAAGIFYAFLPWRFTQLPHIAYVSSGWLPLLIVVLRHYAQTPTWRKAALFGTVFLMNGLSNLHWLAFGALAIALTVPLLVAPRHWHRIAAATLIACCVLAPFLYPYIRAANLYGMTRSWAETMSFSATWNGWLNPGIWNRLYAGLADRRGDPESWLFPGFLAIVLSVAGAIVALRQRNRAVGIALLWLTIGFIGSLGLHAFFHRFLFTHVPGFHSIRVPARWANIAYVGMAMLIALALAPVARKRRWIAAVIAVAFIVELRAAPIRWYCLSPTIPQVHQWLASQKHARVLFLPIDDGVSEYKYLRYATVHHRKMVNGVSSFVPKEFWTVAGMWHDPARRDELIEELRRIGVNLIIIHGDDFSTADRDWVRALLQSGRISYVRRFDGGVEGDWVFSLDAGPRTAPELERYLHRQYTYNSSTFGVLDYPAPNSRVRVAIFSGWVLSPWGVRSVNLLLDDGAVRLPAKLIPEPGLNRLFPWYDATTRPRYVAQIDDRPWYINRDTDVQVEIIDGRGERTLLEGRWFRWDR